MGKTAIYVYHGLKLAEWRPPVEILATIKEWLLQPPTSSEMPLAQFILDHLSWTRINSLSEPFLGIMFHQNTAILLIEVYMEHKSKSGHNSQFVTWVWPRLFNCMSCNAARECYLPLLDIADPKVAVLRKHFNVNNTSVPLDEVVVDSVIAFGVLRLTRLGLTPFTKYSLPLWKSLVSLFFLLTDLFSLRTSNTTLAFCFWMS